MFERVNVEITQRCFLRCNFCPNTGKQTEEMPLELFEKICKELKGHTRLLALHILGDPMSVGALESYCDMAWLYGLRVEITTVGLCLTRLVPLIAHPALKQVNFSLTSFFGNTMNISFEDYLKAIVCFCWQKQEINPKLFVNLRFWNQESVHLQTVLDELGKHFHLGTSDHKGRYRLLERVFLCCDSLFVWPSLNNPIFQEQGYCLGLKSHIGVLVDGRVVPCCLDHGGEMILGDLKTQALVDILHSERAICMRNGFSKHLLVEELCKRCGYIQRFL